jgi:hypothetical protein
MASGRILSIALTPPRSGRYFVSWFQRQGSPIRIVRSVLLLFLFVTALSCSEKNDQVISCTSILDCPADYPLCKAGLCSKSCYVDQDCPIDQNGQQWKCLPDGTCQNAQCVNDIDCCAAGVSACPASCIDGQCVGTACQPGDEEGCFNGCHKGAISCVNGLWAVCDAPPVLEVEICGDGIDNDCFQGVDDGCAVCEPGQEQPCSTSCDAGKQLCGPEGQWGVCSASTDCNCSPGDIKSEPCGNCGHKDLTCTGDKTWGTSEICLDEGDCSFEETEELACGKCGVQTRTCLEGCVWGEYSEECANEGVCDPGDSMEGGCTPQGGGCGSQQLTCNDICEWDEGPCISGAGCTEGETQVISCGSKCGEEISVCDANCNWVSNGICQELGECIPGQIQIADCGQCGEKSRECTDSCSWEEWTLCNGSGDCEPGAIQSQFCGPVPAIYPCQSGTQTQTCNENCLWGGWESCVGAVYPEEEICGNGIDEDCSGADMTLPDTYENNNTCNDCHWLGADPENEVIFPTTDHPMDVDYFCFEALDGTTVFGEETITVTLTDQPAGVDNDLYLYKGYTNCQSNNYIGASLTDGSADESITWPETSGADEGVYIIKVEPWLTSSGNCYIPYKLKVNGLN